MSKRLKHGHSRDNGLRTITYNSWANMVKRCTNPNQKRYKHYGGRGIKVAERWRDFRNFLADVGERPSLKYSIDRFPDNDGNYEPGNVRWATSKQQHETQRHRGGGKKGQGAGEANAMAELTLEEVREIRKVFPLTNKTGPRSHSDKKIIDDLCARLAISAKLAQRIASGRRWGSVV